MLTNKLREVESVIEQLRMFMVDRPRSEVEMYLEPLMAYRYYLLTT
jgi:hypothetical protein